MIGVVLPPQFGDVVAVLENYSGSNMVYFEAGIGIYPNGEDRLQRVYKQTQELDPERAKHFFERTM